MSPQWFWKHADSIRGPLETREVQDLILSHQVLDADEFQLAGRKDWIPATKVKSMFRFGIAQQLRRRPGVDSGNAPDSAAIDQLVSEHGGPAENSRLPAATVAAAANVIHMLTIVPLQWMLERAGVLWGIASSKAGIAIIVAAGLVTAFFLGDVGSGPADVGPATDRERFLAVAAAWVSLEDHLQPSVSDAEWDAFQEQNSQSLQQLIVTLEQTLEQSPSTAFYWFRSSRDQAIANRELLAAARHLHRLITSDARPATSGNPTWFHERRVFGARLNMAHDLLDIGLPDQEQVWGQAERGPVRSSDRTLALLLPIMLVVDVLLLVGGGVFWWRRRRSV